MNCEDLFFNLIWAAEARRGANNTTAIAYVRPQRRLDISGLSRVGISRNTSAHATTRAACIAELARLLGNNSLEEMVLQPEQGRPLCGMLGLGCIYL